MSASALMPSTSYASGGLHQRRALRNPARRKPTCAAAVITTRAVARPTAVACEVEKTSWNSRKLFACVPIRAPVDLVWGCLTDYEGLHTFIPSLVENRCLQRRSNGAVIYQVGAQDVAMGVKFSAACTLDCSEYVGGLPASMCSTSGDGSDGLIPSPRMPGQGSWRAPPSSNGNVKGLMRDIAFKLVEGDFKAFRGVWRMQQGSFGPESTLLGYSLYVQPQAWLPVGLIETRIRKEIERNLQAVRKHAESLHMGTATQRIGVSSTGSMLGE